MRIHEAGLRTGRPLVLVHGLSTSHRCWDRNLADLGARRRILLVELFPRGRHSPAFSLAEAADQLVEVLEGEGAGDVIGHSMGGLIALSLAVARPELVDRLVLASAPVLREASSLISRAASVVSSGSRSDPRSIALVLATVVAAGPRRIASATRATLAADLSELAATVTQPTLLLWGTRDRLVSPAIGQRLAEIIPGARLAFIQNAGHDAMWEAPDDFNAAVMDFLGQA